MIKSNKSSRLSSLSKAVTTALAGAVLSAGMLAFPAAAADKAPEIKEIERIAFEYREEAPKFMAEYDSMDKVNAFNKAAADTMKFTDIKPKLIKVKSELDGTEIEVALYEPQFCEKSTAACPVYKEGERKGIRRADRPLILFSHGGGYLFRTAYYEAAHMQMIANTTQSLVAVPRYRLSSEKPFPAALLDSYSALDYLYNNAAEYRIDQDHIFLWGESAGGNLAAGLALYNRDHYDFPIAAQILFAPMLDYRTGTDKSPYKSTVAGEVTWTAKSNAFAWSQFGNPDEVAKMGPDPRKKMISKTDYMGYFSPVMAQDKSRLPATYIFVGDIDLFAQESVSYANDLLNANVPVDLNVSEGLFHWFDRASADAERTSEYYDSIFSYFKRHLKY